jgi:hypothetical protein
MSRLRVFAYAWVVAAALGGCAAGEAEGEYGVDVRVTSPELVAVSPGVQVVADADEPLFYADGYYWLYRDNTWMRSDNYRSGFARIDLNVVPSEIRGIQQPRTYARYRRNGGRAYARGGQFQERAPMRPQGTQQYPQQQPQQQQQPLQQRQVPEQRPMPVQRPDDQRRDQRPYEERPLDQKPIDQRPMENKVPPRPAEPGTTPTEPTPSSPYQKTPVANPIPGHEGMGDDDHNRVDSTLPSQRKDDMNRDTDKDRDRDAKPNKPNKEDKSDKERDYGK